MQKRLFIIHGWEATSKNDWFPWLTHKAGKNGFEVHNLDMPDTEHPILEKWLGHLKNSVGVPDEHTYLVGHSLGTLTSLRYAESLPEETRIGGIILVAGFTESIGYPEINSFLEPPLDFEKVKRSVGRIVAIHSTDDPVVTAHHADILRDRLGAELLIISNAGHFNGDDGFYQFPLVLQKLIDISS